VLGVEKDLVLVPTLHDTPGEIAMPFERDRLEEGRVRTDPRQDHARAWWWSSATIRTSTRNSPRSARCSIQGNGGKGMNWDTKHEVEFLGELNHAVTEAGISQGDARNSRPRSTRRGHPACWRRKPTATSRSRRGKSLGASPAVNTTPLAVGKEHEAIRFRDIQAQPRKIISSPIWSGLEDENVSYNAGYTNVHELIPWRTLTGRQQFYQDHEWMRAFGEGFMGYRPPVDTKTIKPMHGKKPNGNKEIVLNWITPHQKWGIHSTYSDNLLMQTLSRGGPIVWLSEDDAKSAGIEDNDWIELFNVNGAMPPARWSASA
jgi:nitrate reductase alpha subunit